MSATVSPIDIDVGLQLRREPRDITEMAACAAYVVLGPTFGLVKRCVEMPPIGIDIPRMFTAQGPRRLPGWRLGDAITGSGVSVHAETARIAAISETIERYCSVAPVPSMTLVWGSCRDLDGAAVGPERFALLSDRQYGEIPGLCRLTSDVSTAWTWARSLTTGRPALLPAALVHTDAAARLEDRFVPEVGSSGVACHVSSSAAILSAICEVCERDALTIAWHNRLPLVALDPVETSLGELLDGPLASFEAKLLRLPTDVPYAVVLAIVNDNGPDHNTAVGCACRPNPVDAATKAVFEACQTLRQLALVKPNTSPTVRSFQDHAHFYAGASGRSLLAANLPLTGTIEYLRDQPAYATGSPSSSVEFLVAALQRTGLEVYVADLTTPDVAVSGFRVVRALVPGMLEMSADPRFARLGGDRLYELPVSLGLLAERHAEHELNRLPVPLA